MELPTLMETKAMRKMRASAYFGPPFLSMCIAAALLVPMASAASAPEAAAPRPTAASNGGPFIACSTSGGAGIDTYITGVFRTAYPVKYLPSGGYLVDQSVLDRFYAYLTKKGYHF